VATTSSVAVEWDALGDADGLGRARSVTDAVALGAAALRTGGAAVAHDAASTIDEVRPMTRDSAQRPQRRLARGKREAGSAARIAAGRSYAGTFDASNTRFGVQPGLDVGGRAPPRVTGSVERLRPPGKPAECPVSHIGCI
jgi:hypothetical protein